MTLASDHTLDAALAALVEEFAGVFRHDTIEQCLNESYQELLPARVTGYLPLLAHRFARERLRAATRTRPDPVAETSFVPLVLFVCGANSGRSQLAAALLKHRAGASVEVASAGTSAGSRVQPEVLEVLGEMGIETSDLFPKPVTREVDAAADVVVTMGCAERADLSATPRRYLDWDVTDPAGADLAEVRRIRDEIDHRIEALVRDLLHGPAGHEQS